MSSGPVTQSVRTTSPLAGFTRPNGIGIIQVVLDFSEMVARDLFVACLRAGLARHSLVAPDEGRGLEAPPRFDDWSHLARDDAERRFATVLDEDRLADLGTTHGAPIRIRFFGLADEASRVLISYDMTLMDGIGRERLLTELIRSYDSARAERPYAPPRLRPGAAPAIDDHEAALAFWRVALDGLACRRSLDHRGAARAQATHHLVLPAAQLADLRESAAAMKAPLAIVIYAAWALCLHRIERESDVAFLTIRNLRAGAGLARGAAIGSLVNLAPLRVTIDRRQMLAEFVHAVAEFWERSRPHIGCDLPRIHAACGLHAHDWTTNILVQRDRFTAWFANSVTDGAKRRVRVHDHSNAPLTVAATYDAELHLHLQYWPSVYAPELAATIARSLAALLVGIAENPHRTLGELPYLALEQRQQLEDWAAGPRDLAAANRMLHADFEAQAAQNPDAVAVRADTQLLAYSELDAAANALAAHLVASGVAAEEPVAIFNGRDLGYLIGLLATLKAGAAFLPISATAPDSQIRAILAASGARRALCSPQLAARVATLPVAVVILDDRLLSARAARPPRLQSDPDSLAYLIATSGTTGTPKIVEVAHRAAANTIRHSIIRFYAAKDLALVPWTDASTTDAAIQQIFAPLGSGGTLVKVTDLGRLKAHPSFTEFTAFGGTPSVLTSLLAADAIPPAASAVMFGGESCRPGLAARLQTVGGLQRAANVYGPTEAAIFCTADDALAPAPSGPSRIGRPITNMRIDLLDDGLQPVLPGTAGEICISGIGLARGYRGRPDLTEAAFSFVTDEAGSRRRIYRSGDYGAWLPDGALSFLGRRDRQVKIRGVRIELDAVEHELRTLSGIRQAVVGVRSSSDAASQLVGWVTTEEDCTEAALLDELRTKLPVPMVPERLTIVERIPLNANGKPDLSALPNNTAPPGKSADDPGDVVAPELLAVMARTLAVPVATITHASTIHNTWGWNSLRHMMLMMELEEAFGIALADAEISAAISVAAITRLLQEKSVL